MRQVWTSPAVWRSIRECRGRRVPSGGFVKQIAIQVKELVSANLNALAEAAANPAKMLRLLQHELEEAVIALQADRTKALRLQDRLAEDSAAHEKSAEDWTDKAKLAMTHKREDLARAALLAREVALEHAGNARQEAAKRAAEAAELAGALAQLEAKLAQTTDRLRAERAIAATGAAASAGDSPSERMLDRAGQLEQRIAYAQDRPTAPSQQAIDLEIDQLARASRIEQELLAIKAAAQSGPVKKPKSAR